MGGKDYLKAIPNPGSDEALHLGCTCAVLDNGHGKGAFDLRPGQFWVTEDCPVHGKQQVLVTPAKIVELAVLVEKAQKILLEGLK